MAPIVLLQALPVLLAISQTASGKPFSPRGYYPQVGMSNGSTVWPQQVTAEVHNTTWTDFTEKTERWSTYKAPTFDQVFLPQTEEDLSLGLEYMSSKNMSWLAKSGGHGYSTSLSAIQNGVLINLENFNTVNIESDGTAVVGTGVLFQDFVDAVGAAGRELTVGSCGCVGATGAMLGGGLGRLQGLHGLTSDALRKVRMALWNGTIVEASDDVNQELFWGVRGSGQNYGVVFESTYETWPSTNEGMHYNADMTFTKDSVQQIMELTNNLTISGLDDKLSFVMFLANNVTTSELTVIVNIVYSGPQKEGQKYTQLFSPLSHTLTETMLTWAELPTKSVLGLIPASCASGPRYDLYSAITRVLDPSTFVEFADDFERFLQDNPLASNSAIMIETFPVQGVEALPDDYSAFPHRKNFQNQIESIGVYTDDSVADTVDGFFRGWRDTFAKPEVSGYDGFYIYQNYGHGDEPLSALYGTDKSRQERLTNIKNAYDPHGFFNGYHAIPSDLSQWS
ncbi:putative FAD-binding PCMH-type domain-containing protein [Seiridium unicorne]|uniref:FAD-binding PCMH-type domain-containing protein n=1 Tax=Seiridium unicorne TaxID=138068 RepID=A0ABR2UIQ5_9PEZI